MTTFYYQIITITKNQPIDNAKRLSSCKQETITAIYQVYLNQSTDIAHFAAKSELFVVKEGSFGAKIEFFGERILLRKRDYLVRIQNCKV